MKRKKISYDYLIPFLKRNGITLLEAKKNKNFEVVMAGCDLGFLFDEDVLYMLKESTTEIQAGNRMVTRRKEFYGQD